MRSSVRAWLGLLATSVPILAQNSSSFAGCPAGTEELADGQLAFNATKSASFELHTTLGEWYLSLGLRDTRAANLGFGDYESGQWLEFMLSVPESLIGSQQGNNTEYCVYRFPARNETADDDEEPGSCKGVLSDDCVEAMENSQMSGDEGCPSIDVSEECGFNWELSTSTRSNFTNGTCALDSVPNIDLPGDYRTYTSQTSSGPQGDREIVNFDTYDLRTRQQFPVLIMGSWSNANRGQKASKVLCLAPDDIVEGSREPESGAERLQRGPMVVVGTIMLGLMWESLGGRLL
ncbi:hypothetical protein LIA77_05001 [Sarocladium implicatum]|nr:hypothetical protein LIA77_05001 [Sarocladium implicatum]